MLIPERPPDDLVRVLKAEATAPLPPPLRAVAEAARARHGGSIAAVLVYGSCFRAGDDANKIVDLYLLADGYPAVHRNPIVRLLNALLPPNVYYLETAFEQRTVRAKYGIVSLPHFERLVAPRTFHPYFWARFAQPTAIAWARDAATLERVAAALAKAAATLVGEVRPLLDAAASSRELWIRAFSETYRTELRAERPDRAAELYAAHTDRYDRLAGLLGANPGAPVSGASKNRKAAARRWLGRRVLGKALSVARLIKAAFTFQDGAAYLMGKIEQHSGVTIPLTPWQRRHPILASTVLFWRLRRKGAFR